MMVRLSLESFRGGRSKLIPPTTNVGLVRFFADLFAVALAGKGFLDTLLLAWFQVEGVTLDFLDDVLGLNLALEAAQGILERLTFLYTNLCQEKNTSSRP